MGKEKPPQKFESSLTRLAKELDAASPLKRLLDANSGYIKQLHQAQSIIDQHNQTYALNNSRLFDQIYRDAQRSVALTNALYGQQNQLVEAARQQMEPFQRIAEATRQQMEPFQRMVDSIDTSGLAQIHSQMFEQANQYKAIADSMNMHVNAAMSSFAHLGSLNKRVEEISKSVAIRMYEELRDHPGPIESTLSVMKDVADTDVPSDQRSFITYDGWVQIFVTLLFFSIATYQNQQSEENILNAIDAIHVELAEKLTPEVVDETEAVEYYVSTANLHVRGGPGTDHPILDKIHPNQKVGVIRNEGRWLYVEYFDYVDEIPRYGWVYKRYLKDVSDLE